MKNFLFTTILFSCIFSNAMKCNAQEVEVNVNLSGLHQFDIFIENNSGNEIDFDKCPIVGQKEDFQGNRVKTILEVYVKLNDSTYRQVYFDRLRQDYLINCLEKLKSGEQFEFTYDFGPNLYRYIDSNPELIYKIHFYYMNKGSIEHRCFKL